MKNKIKNSFLNALMLSVLVSAALILNTASAYALDVQHYSESAQTTFEAAVYEDFEAQMVPSASYLYHDYAQSQKKRWKSRGAVMSQVKRRYDARVLKITLNEAREVYVVRVLMPNGKVRTVQVSALR